MASRPTKAELKRNLKALQERLQERAMDLDARMRIARTYRLLEKKHDAIAHYAAVARYLSLAGHPLQAIAVLKELLQLDAKHEASLLFLAKLYARTRAADATNRGRIAVPILEAGESPNTWADGIPLTTTGIWRAIAPAMPEDLAVVHDADELGAAVDASAETSAEQSAPVDRDSVSGGFGSGGSGSSVSKGPAPDAAFGDDDVILGHMTTGDVLLPRVSLFSSLSAEAFSQLSHAMLSQRALAGARIFDEGAPGDSCVVISRGQAKVTRKDRFSGQEIELARLGEGDIAGIFALVSSQVRHASVTAVTDVEYYEIDRGAVDELVQKFPVVRESLGQFFRERLVLNLLASLPFFSHLGVDERGEIAKRFQERNFDVDDELFSEGSENNGLWIVLEGEVKLGHERDDGSFHTVATLGAGDYVGALVEQEGGVTDLAAVATKPARCALLTHKVLTELIEKHGDLRAAHRRMQSAGRLLGEHVYAGSGMNAGNGMLTGALADHDGGSAPVDRILSKPH